MFTARSAGKTNTTGAEPHGLGGGGYRSESVQAELHRVVAAVLEPWRAQLATGGDHILRGIVENACALASDDLLALTEKDPASKGSWCYVLRAYSCFRAVLAHRIAHAVLSVPGLAGMEALTISRSISERAKVETGVEIHPAATIARRFVVDHGMGTVIGEGVIIGEDCYILQGVVLGSLGIAYNPSGRRHPRLGDRVEVGGFARLLGPITVGDDVVVGSHALVRTDVPAGSHVAVLHQYQINSGSRPIVVYGVEMLGSTQVVLHGVDLDRIDLEVDLLDPAHEPLPAGDVRVLRRSAECLILRISPRAWLARAVTHIRLRHGDSTVTLGIPTGHPNPAQRRTA